MHSGVTTLELAADRQGRYAERPLSLLPPSQAAKFVHELHRVDERLYRTLRQYWQVQACLPDPAAEAMTQDELVAAESIVLANLSDPHYHTIGTVNGAGMFEPVGMFGFRDLAEHPRGRVLADVIAHGSLASSYKGCLAIAHSTLVLDRFSGRTALSTIFLSIALKALEGNFTKVLFFTSDHRLRGIYERFGMEYPEALAFPDTQHQVGSYDPWAPGNLERMRRGARVLGKDIGRWGCT